MLAPGESMLIALVQDVASCWLDQYQTLIVVPTTMSSGPSPFTSPAPRALMGFAVELAELHPWVEPAPGNVLQMMVPVVPNPVRIRTVVPNAMASSRPDCVPEKFPILSATIEEVAVQNAPDGVVRPPAL